MQYPTGTCIISRLSYLYTKFGQVVINNSRYIVISMCVDNEFLVGSIYEVHQSLWRNDSHCVCLCLYRSFMFRHTCLVFCPDLEYK